MLRPGGTLAVTVPRWLRRRSAGCSPTTTANEGGHIRIYKADELRAKLIAGGLRFTHSEYAHGLHSPFWWLKCAVGVEKPDHPAVQAYHRLLVWDMMSRPALTRVAEAALNPLSARASRCTSRSRTPMARRSDLDGVPGVAGVLTPAQCRQTAESIAALQLPSGEIPCGHRPGHTDVWDPWNARWRSPSPD